MLLAECLVLCGTKRVCEVIMSYLFSNDEVISKVLTKFIISYQVCVEKMKLL